MTYFWLFVTFFKIGLFGFGGGYAMLTMIQHEVVEVQHWMNAEEFADMVALSQVTPGPISINCATYIGYTSTHSIWGSVVATLSFLLPSVLLMIVVLRLLTEFSSNRYVAFSIEGLRSAVAGLIAAAAVLLITPTNFVDIWSWLLFAAALCLSLFTKTNPIYIIVASGVIGWLVYGL